jgi:uncharacterized protein (TIGR02145 family)
MTIWSGEIKELDKLYVSFKGHLPDIVKELEQLIRTDDANVVMLYSRRCLEVIVTDLCECELKRPRKTEPLKGIIDKLNSEEKVPSHIITSMHSLNSMSTYGTHPKDFDPEQVKPVLNNLAIIIRWYLKYKDFQIVSKTSPEEEKSESKVPDDSERVTRKPKKRIILLLSGVILVLVIIIVIVIRTLLLLRDQKESEKYRSIDTYKTVTIGNQIWMAENLKTTLFNDGKPIPQVKGTAEWENLKTPAYCWYDNDRTTYRETYGALYNWYAVNTGKLCPTGWHVPSDAEWKTLTLFLGDSISWTKEVSGIKLKEAGNAHWAFNDSIASTNEYGFTALPGGTRTIYGVFFGIGYEGRWWSSTEDEYNKDDAKNREMRYEYGSVTEIQQYKQFGMSVRCIKDK